MGSLEAYNFWVKNGNTRHDKIRAAIKETKIIRTKKKKIENGF